MSAFCAPEATTSIPQASVSKGTAPRLETASTALRAPASRAAAANGCGSITTPVEVSEWVKKRITASRSRRRAATSSTEGISAQA
jgi:hypothetical protein